MLGKNEAVAAGKALKSAGYTFDVAHTSKLTRAQNTLKSILKEIGQENLPTEQTWRLNERHYGGLTGMNKAETAAKYGEEQVQIWRRSFDTPPPPMEDDHKYYETIVKDPRYAGEPKPEEFPRFESLKLTIDRTLPYWNNTIIPQLKEGKKIIIAAHGNSLRGIVKHLDGKLMKFLRISVHFIHSCVFLSSFRLEQRPDHGFEFAHRNPIRLRIGRELQACCVHEVPWRRGDC